MPRYPLEYGALVARKVLPLAASLSMSAGLKICAVAVLLQHLDPIWHRRPFLIWGHHRHYAQLGHRRLWVKMLWAMNTTTRHKVSSL